MFVGMYTCMHVCLVPLFTIPIWINGQHGRYSRGLLVRVGGMLNVICIGKSIKVFGFRWPTKVIQLKNTDLSDLSSYLTPLHLLFESPEWFAHRLAVDWKRHRKWAWQKKYQSRENKKAFQKGTVIRLSGYCSIMWNDQQTETIPCQRPRQTTALAKTGHQMNLGGVHFIGQTQNSPSSPVSLVYGARWLGTALNGGVIAAPRLSAGRHPDCALHTKTGFKCLNRIISETPGSTGKGFLNYAQCLGIVAWKMTNPSSTHPHIVPNPYFIVPMDN